MFATARNLGRAGVLLSALVAVFTVARFNSTGADLENLQQLLGQQKSKEQDRHHSSSNSSNTVTEWVLPAHTENKIQLTSNSERSDNSHELINSAPGDKRSNQAPAGDAEVVTPQDLPATEWQQQQRIHLFNSSSTEALSVKVQSPEKSDLIVRTSGPGSDLADKRAEMVRNDEPLKEGGEALEVRGIMETHYIPAAEEERTLAFKQIRFASGFRNAGMSFTWFVMYARQNNYTSILLDALNWKDLYGRSRPWGYAPHALLFDVEYWNSKFPQVPRLVPFNATIHPHFDPVRKSVTAGITDQNATHPSFYGTYLQGFNQYRMYTKRVLSDPVKHPRSPVEVAMMRGAFRPSVALADRMRLLTEGAPYLALHARIEPDMQKHPVCRDRKVLLMSDIVRGLEARFPEPDFRRVFVATNRPMLEHEAATNPTNNPVAVDNLRELNRLRDQGLWNGTVKVFEAGASYLRAINASEDEIGRYVGIGGAAMDYFLALEATVFVGTPVSSFSADVIQSRFFRANLQNYHYRPDGVHLATEEGDFQPPRFEC